MTTQSTPRTDATAAFRAARDHLLSLAGHPDRARAEFTFPDVGEHFNWAIDWFDQIPRGNTAPALIVVEEEGHGGPVMAGHWARAMEHLVDGARRARPAVP